MLGSRFAGQTVIVDDSEPEKIVITPAAVIPATEAWLYKNKKALNSVRKGLAQAKDHQSAKDAPNVDEDSALAGRR